MTKKKEDAPIEAPQVPSDQSNELDQLNVAIVTLKGEKEDLLVKIADLQADNEIMAETLQDIANEEANKPTVLLVGSADMSNIQKAFIAYDVKFEEGEISPINFSKILFDRADFPVDDDFSADFMDRELMVPEEVAKPDPENSTLRERVLYDEYQEKMKMHIKALRKQTSFRKIRNLTIQITERE